MATQMAPVRREPFSSLCLDLPPVGGGGGQARIRRVIIFKGQDNPSVAHLDSKYVGYTSNKIEWKKVLVRFTYAILKSKTSLQKRLYT